MAARYINHTTNTYDDEAGEKSCWPFWGCFGPNFPKRVTSAQIWPKRGSQREVWINANKILYALGDDALGDVRGVYLRSDGECVLTIFRGGFFTLYPIGR